MYCEPPVDGRTPWKAVVVTLLKSAAGAATAMFPAAATGYALADWGGIEGGIAGGLVGAALGFVSGRQVHKVARKMAQKAPEQLGLPHKMALKCGWAAPYVFSLGSCVGCGLAGGTLAPALAALVFAKTGMITGALVTGTKQSVVRVKLAN